ncbi:hypothetical protein OESDEN_10113, partial [Oesophagostomum dentatum]
SFPNPKFLPLEKLWFRSYAWRAVFLTSFTLGIRFGNLDATSDILLKCFGIRVIFVITYLILPLGIVYGSKLKQKDLNIHEKRIILIGLSALLGMLSSVVNQHYIVKDGAAPSYFLPCLTGLTIQLVGPQYGHDRVRFLAVSVGSAFAVGVLLMAAFRDISFAALFDLTLSAISATINLQFTLATIKHGVYLQTLGDKRSALYVHSGGIDMMAGHQSAVLMALFQHLSFSRLHGKYLAAEKARPSVTKPLFYS